MGRQKCPACGGGMIRYGKTKAGFQRWQCPACNATSTRRIDNAAKLLAAFLGWLLSGKRQADMPGSGTDKPAKTSAAAPFTGDAAGVLPSMLMLAGLLAALTAAFAFREYRKELLALAKEEGYDLSDDELASVSGGGDWSCDNACNDYDPEPHSR